MDRTKVPAKNVKRFPGRTETANQKPDRAPMMTRRGAVIGLLIIVVLAASLRLVSLTQSPPGLNQDEAALDEAINILAQLRETWAQAEQIVQQEQETPREEAA